MNFIYHIYSYLRIIPYKGIEYIKKYVNGTPFHHTERLYDIPARKRIINHITNLFIEPTHIIDNIYLGNAYNASNYAIIKQYNFNYIINVTKEIKNYYEQQNIDFYSDINNVEIKNVPTSIFSSTETSITIYDNYCDIKYLRIPIYDDCTNHITDYIKEAMDFIDDATRNNTENNTGNNTGNNTRNNTGNILIHCYMGSSRSASIVLAYLIHKYDYSLSDALLFLKNKRNIVNINVNFVNDIKTYFEL